MTPSLTRVDLFLLLLGFCICGALAGCLVAEYMLARHHRDERLSGLFKDDRRHHGDEFLSYLPGERRRP